MDQKLRKIVYIGLIVCFIIFLFLFLLTSCDNRISPKELELKIFNNTKNYFKNHEEELPQEDSILNFSISELSNRGIIKDINKLVKKEYSCSGDLTIENNNNYYMYSPNITCTSQKNNYTTKNLKEEILKDLVTSGNGLYQINNNYYYRGDTINNYLILDGIKWRITKINADNSIRLIEDTKRDNQVWDNRYNEDKKSTTGKNDYILNSINSRMKDYLENIYKTETVLSNESKGYIKKTNLCIGKRNDEDTINDGSLECSNVIENQYIGLLQLNEYLIASLDPNCIKTTSVSCKNYNYLANYITSYWTITADSSTTDKVYKINPTPYSTTANNSGLAKMVINISENTTVTGKGTDDDPYLVTGFDKELKKFD